MNNLMTLWAETFKKFYPNVKIQVEGKGSSTAPPGAHRRHRAARADVAADEVDRDRPVRAEVRLQADRARDQLRRARRLRPQGQPDQAAHAGAGRRHLRKSRKRGCKQNITTWGQLGLTGEWASRPISLYGRNSACGTYGFFKEHVLKNGDYKDTVKEQPGSASVVQGVTEDRYAHRLQRHRLQDLRREGRAARREPTASPFFRGTLRGRTSGNYPLAASSTSTSTRRPGRPLDPLPLEFAQARDQQGRPGGRRQGRLHAADRRPSSRKSSPRSRSHGTRSRMPGAPSRGGRATARSRR